MISNPIIIAEPVISAIFLQLRPAAANMFINIQSPEYQEHDGHKYKKFNYKFHV